MNVIAEAMIVATSAPRLRVPSSFRGEPLGVVTAAAPCLSDKVARILEDAQ
jgi:hypothetical protein